MDSVLAYKPKGRQFNSQSGHVPRLWASSPVEDVQEATNQCISLTLVFLSLPLSLPFHCFINK